MRRAYVTIIAAAALLSAVVAFGERASGATTPTQKVTISGTQCPGGHVFCYKPASLTVKSTTKVVWKNATGVPHTVTRCTKVSCGVSGGTGKDTKFASPTIKPGGTYAFVFHHVGTYRYFCKIHGYGIMHATITVR